MTQESYLRNIIDAIPSAIFIVNKELQVIDFNQAASKIYNADSDIHLKKLCGEVIHCLNEKESEKICGDTEFCHECVIRNSVQRAINGKSDFKKKYKMKLQRGETVERVYLLISSAPLKNNGQTHAILTIDDITEITELANLLPICANCKKIKRDEKFWENLESYFYKHTEIKFTHSICPDCYEELYSEFDYNENKNTVVSKST